MGKKSITPFISLQHCPFLSAQDLTHNTWQSVYLPAVCNSSHPIFPPSKIAVLCYCLPKAWLINNSATLYNHSKWNLYMLIYFGEYVKEGFFIMLSLHVIIVIAVALYLFHLSKKILE